MPTLTAIVTNAVVAAREAKRTGQTLSADEALARACSKDAGGLTLIDFKRTVRAISISAEYESEFVLRASDMQLFCMLGLLLSPYPSRVVDSGAPKCSLQRDVPAAKAWLNLVVEMGDGVLQFIAKDVLEKILNAGDQLLLGHHSDDVTETRDG